MCVGTKKLVAVCRMRKISILFINKLDREGKDAFDLMDEVEQKLGLTVTLKFPNRNGYMTFKEFITYGNKT
jgi:peptide chain release factor 3